MAENDILVKFDQNIKDFFGKILKFYNTKEWLSIRQYQLGETR